MPRQRPHKLRPVPISQFPIIPLSLFCQCQKRPAGIRRALLVYRDIPICQSLSPWEQQRRPPPAADRGRSCWGSGQQDASAFARSERWEPQPGFHKEKPLSALGHPGSGQLFKKPAIPGTWVPASGLPPAFWTQRLRRLCGRLTILYHEFRHAATRAKSLLRKTCQNPLTPPRCCGKMILR